MCANTCTVRLPQESVLLARSPTLGSHYAHLIKNLCCILTSRLLFTELLVIDWNFMLIDFINTTVLLRIIINSNQLNTWCLINALYRCFLNCLERLLNGYLAAKCFPHKKNEQNQRHRALAHRTVTYPLQCQAVQKLWWYPIQWSVNGLNGIILYLCSFHWYKAIRNPLQKWFFIGTLKALESLSDALCPSIWRNITISSSRSMPDITKRPSTTV